MRKVFLLGITAFVLLWASAAFYGEEKPAGANDTQADVTPNNVDETLIDFTTYEDRIEKSGVYIGKDEPREKAIKDLDPTNAKEVDPDTLAPAYEIQASDMKFDRWLVQLNSSANTNANRRWSYAKSVKLKASKKFKNQAGEESDAVLGVRVRFPSHTHNAYARISPPYEIRAYYPNGQVVSQKNEGKFIGVVNNVGELKKISLDVSGRNFKHGVALRLKDQFDEVKEYFMGYLYFANWRKLSWNNPNYITSVDHRQLFRVPLYPREVPYKKFDSFIVYRPGRADGGDFVVYFRKVNLWFDFAVPPEQLSDLDIDDEATWRILTKRARDRRRLEQLKYREKLELMRQEAKRLGKNQVKKDVAAEDKAGNGGGAPATKTDK
jgi:hypothetical protein